MDIPESLPTACATTFVVTLSSGMFNNFVTVLKIDSPTPTAASCALPACKHPFHGRMSQAEQR